MPALLTRADVRESKRGVLSLADPVPPRKWGFFVNSVYIFVFVFITAVAPNSWLLLCRNTFSDYLYSFKHSVI